MGTAREDFLGHLVAINEAADLSALRDATPPDPAQSEVARVLRNGLAVAAFAALEDFLKRRNRELLAFASTGVSTYDELTPELRRAVVHRALSSLAAQARRAADDQVERRPLEPLQADR